MSQTVSFHASLESKVRNFKDADFILDSKTPLILRYKNRIVILFYNNANYEDRKLIEIWQKIARRFTVVTFAAINIGQESGVMNAINREDNFLSKELPAIILYEDQIPKNFYDGPRNMESIVAFICSI